MAPAKKVIVKGGKALMYAKKCPKCGNLIKRLVKMVRVTKASGMHWVCDCGFEASVSEMK